MASEKIEIEVLVNGKPAIKAIDKVDKKTEKLGKTTKKTGKDVDGALTKMKAGWIAVGASVAIAITKAASFERMSLGLTKAQKEWAKQTALATDIGAEQIAGFLKSAQTAGLAEDQMKSLAEQAIALGYAFPHEDAETLHDNLVMLAKTGEAQGFVVDILEQKYVGLGENISTLDLKTKSWAEKMKLVGEVAEKSQKQMDASKFKDYNNVMSTIDNTLTDLGTTLVTLGSDGKGFSFAANAAETFKNVLLFIAAGLKDMVVSFGEITGLIDNFTDKVERSNTTQEKTISVEEKLRKLYILRAEIYGELNLLEGEALEAAAQQFAMAGRQIDNLLKYGDAHKDVKEKINASKEAHRQATADASKDLVKLSKAGEDVAKSFGDVFADMVMGGKTSFKDMARSIIARLLQVKAEAIATKALASMVGGGGILSTITGFFGLGAHTGTAEVKHTGGTIGLPSFHSGMRSDERLAKLQVGEAVINRGGAAKNRSSIEAMNKGYAVGGGGGNVTTAEINFTVQAIDAASFNSYLVNNKGTIEAIINQSLASNGTVRRTIRQVI